MESPAKNAAYLSTSDIVVAGRSRSFGQGGTVKILSEKGTAQHAKVDFRVGPREESGKWAVRIASPEHRGWRPRAHRVQVAIEGREVDVPITIVPDLAGEGVPRPVATTVDSDEYLKLPAVKMEAVTLSDPEGNPSKSLPDVGPRNSGTVLYGTDEFAVEGTIRLQKPDGTKSLDIILRLIESQSGRNIAAEDAVIGESLVALEPTDDRALFRYRTVLRAPNWRGKFTLDAIYRQRVIAASLIEVGRDAVEEEGTGWIIEYPPPDAIYATTSHIVVAGRGRPAPMAIVLQMHDARDVIQQSAGVTAGGPFNDGAWAIQLRLPRRSVWRAGKYQIDVCPVFGRQISFPVTVIAEEAKPPVPAEELTKIGSNEYDALPCLILPDVTLSNPDSATPEVTVGKHTRNAIFRIGAGQEFSCESTVTFLDDGTFVPADVIVRLTRDAQKPDDPRTTVDEAIAKYELAQGRPDRFRSVLRVSNVPGKLKLDAIYRKAVIASAVIEVVPGTE